MVPFYRDRKSLRRGSSSLHFLVVVILVFSGLFSIVSPPEISHNALAVDRTGNVVPSVLMMDPAATEMRLWRSQLQDSCHQYLQDISGKNITQADLIRKALLEAEALSRMKVPEPAMISPDRPAVVYPTCDHIFLDLGTNRGDSISCAVDASLDVCSSLFVRHDRSMTRAYRISKDFPRLHFNVTDLQIHGKGSQAMSLLRLLQTFFASPGMECVCVYGMEGNRFFNQRLHAMEEVINHMQPRPLKFLHIHTETIITSRDGQSSLFIDQYSEKNHVSWRRVGPKQFVAFSPSHRIIFLTSCSSGVRAYSKACQIFEELRNITTVHQSRR